MNIKVKNVCKENFLLRLEELNYSYEYNDFEGYYRIFDNKNDVLVGKFQIWNNVVIYYFGQAQRRFINDLIIELNQYLEIYE